MTSILLNVLFALFISVPAMADEPIQVAVDLHFKCREGSTVDKFDIVTSLPMEVSCFGYQQGDLVLNLTASIGGSNQEIVSKTKVGMMFVNGNSMAGLLGKVTNGQCEGDHLMIMFVFKAEDQLACDRSGVSKVVIDYGYVAIHGNCNTECTTVEGQLTYADAVKGGPRTRLLY